ncbi:uncharacterized protein [Bos indicus]|uniref:Uncharacterized protein n=1 Tax=Bos indicus TaxID=9915 RepID=A0ABM4TE04_BOSIN
MVQTPAARPSPAARQPQRRLCRADWIAAPRCSGNVGLLRLPLGITNVRPVYFGCYTRFPSQPCADRKLLLTEALRRHCGVPRSAGFDHAQELDPVGPGQARALAPPPSRLTTGSLRTLGRVRRRGRGGGRGGGGGGGRLQSAWAEPPYVRLSGSEGREWAPSSSGFAEGSPGSGEAAADEECSPPPALGFRLGGSASMWCCACPCQSA